MTKESFDLPSTEKLFSDPHADDAKKKRALEDWTGWFTTYDSYVNKGLVKGFARHAVLTTDDEFASDLMSALSKIMRSDEKWLEPVLATYKNYHDFGDDVSVLIKCQDLLERAIAEQPDSYSLQDPAIISSLAIHLNQHLETFPTVRHLAGMNFVALPHTTQEQLANALNYVPGDVTDGDLIACWKACETDEKKKEFLRLYANALTTPPKSQKHLVFPAMAAELLCSFHEDTDQKLSKEFADSFKAMSQCGGDEIHPQIAKGLVIKIEDVSKVKRQKPVRQAVMTPDQVKAKLSLLAY